MEYTFFLIPHIREFTVIIIIFFLVSQQDQPWPGLTRPYTHVTHTSLCLALSPSEKSVYSELTLSLGNESKDRTEKNSKVKTDREGKGSGR